MVKVTSDTTNTPVQESTQEPNFLEIVQQLQAKIAAQDEKLAALEHGDANKIKKAKEKYKGPLQASYRLRSGTPVVSYVSVKKDENQDWLYKDPVHGGRTNNHYLDIVLCTGETKKKVLRDAFDTAKVKSELMEFDVITTNGDRISKPNYLQLGAVTVAKYVFQTVEHGEIEVLPTCIN